MASPMRHTPRDNLSIRKSNDLCATCLPDECIALVLEDPDLLDGSEVGEGLLEELLGEARDDAAAVHRAVGRTRLVVHLVERQGLRVGCNKRNQKRHFTTDLSACNDMGQFSGTVSLTDETC